MVDKKPLNVATQTARPCTRNVGSGLITNSDPSNLIKWYKITWDLGPCHTHIPLLPSLCCHGLHLCKVPMAEMGCYIHHIPSPWPFCLWWYRHTHLSSHWPHSLLQLPCLNLGPMVHCHYLTLCHCQIPLDLWYQSQMLFPGSSFLRNMRRTCLMASNLVISDLCILEGKGFVRISQLSCNYSMSQLNCSAKQWLGIEYGTAVLIFQSVEADMRAISAG